MATAAFVPWADSLTNLEEAAGQKKLVNIIVFFLRENIAACVLNNILRGELQLDKDRLLNDFKLFPNCCQVSVALI